MPYIATPQPTMSIEASSTVREVNPQQQAREFLTAFAANYAQSPIDREQLQAGIDVSASMNCPVPRSERGLVINQVLRHFEHRVRRSAGETQQTHELLVKLNQNLYALDERFALPAPELGRA